jgi:hypothetical protein
MNKPFPCSISARPSHSPSNSDCDDEIVEEHYELHQDGNDDNQNHDHHRMAAATTTTTTATATTTSNELQQMMDKKDLVVSTLLDDGHNINHQKDNTGRRCPDMMFPIMQGQQQEQDCNLFFKGKEDKKGRNKTNDVHNDMTISSSSPPPLHDCDGRVTSNSDGCDHIMTLPDEDEQSAVDDNVDDIIVELKPLPPMSGTKRRHHPTTASHRPNHRSTLMFQEPHGHTHSQQPFSRRSTHRRYQRRNSFLIRPDDAQRLASLISVSIPSSSSSSSSSSSLSRPLTPPLPPHCRRPTAAYDDMMMRVVQNATTNNNNDNRKHRRTNSNTFVTTGSKNSPRTRKSIHSLLSSLLQAEDMMILPPSSSSSSTSSTKFIKSNSVSRKSDDDEKSEKFYYLSDVDSVDKAKDMITTEHAEAKTCSSTTINNNSNKGKEHVCVLDEKTSYHCMPPPSSSSGQQAKSTKNKVRTMNVANESQSSSPSVTHLHRQHHRGQHSQNQQPSSLNNDTFDGSIDHNNNPHRHRMIVGSNSLLMRELRKDITAMNLGRRYDDYDDDDEEEEELLNDDHDYSNYYHVGDDITMDVGGTSLPAAGDVHRCKDKEDDEEDDDVEQSQHSEDVEMELDDTTKNVELESVLDVHNGGGDSNGDCGGEGDISGCTTRTNANDHKNHNKFHASWADSDDTKWFMDLDDEE